MQKSEVAEGEGKGSRQDALAASVAAVYKLYPPVWTPCRGTGSKGQQNMITPELSTYLMPSHMTHLKDNNEAGIDFIQR